MKCKDCDCCRYGYFKWKPNSFVCTGVKQPFEIKNVTGDCTEYPKKNKIKVKEKEMVIAEESINTEFTSDEIRIMENLLSERCAEMLCDLDESDDYMYLNLCQLYAKLGGIINLMNSKKKTNKKSNKNPFDQEEFEKTGISV